MTEISILGTIALVLAFGVAIAFAWMRGRKSPLHRQILARAPLDPDALRGEVANRYTLDPQTTRDVLRALGSSLDIDPGRLRLTDYLMALWDMNPQAGFHQRATFETWMLKHYPKLTETETPSIADLIAAVQRLPMVR